MSTLSEISKRRFGKIRALHTKKERLLTGLTLLEGERMIEEALHEGLPVETVVGTSAFWHRRSDLVHSCSAMGVVTVIANSVQMKMLAKTETTAGVLAVIAKPKWDENLFWEQFEKEIFIGLLCVGLQDPGNVGTIIRTLTAANGAACWFTSGSPEVGAPKTVRASAGTIYKIPTFEDCNPKELIKKCRSKGVQTIAAVPDRGRVYTALDHTIPSLLVLGSEGEGLPKDIVGACEHKATIPMPGGIQSLNVATAGGILIYEILRQRRLISMKRGKYG